jgi:hypothetical protein
VSEARGTKIADEEVRAVRKAYAEINALFVNIAISQWQALIVDGFQKFRVTD